MSSLQRRVFSILLTGLLLDGGRCGGAETPTTLKLQVDAIRMELERAQTSWPADVNKVIAQGDDKSIHAALAEHVFVKVTISPEGRVKVARGPADAQLVPKQSGLFLVQIENQSGGQQRLKALGTNTGDSENPFALSFRKAGRFGTDLIGLPIEYRLLEITSAKAGRHELTIAVEAGQGSQDLGFRAEVPILFSVESK